MKKIIILVGICSVIFACNSNQTSSTETATTQDTTAQLEIDTAAASTEVTPPAGSPSTAQNPPSTAATTPDAAAAPAPAAPAEQKPVSTEKGKQLISKSDCLACHKVDQKLVGPAYTEVAQKYDDTDANLNYLAGKIISGGSGVWGQIPMTPHPAISKDDAKEMARYILSLK